MSAERGFAGLDAARMLGTISPEAIRTSLKLLTVMPLVVPRSNGGIQLEWHEGGLDCEIVINPDGTVDDAPDK